MADDKELELLLLEKERRRRKSIAGTIHESNNDHLSQSFGSKLGNGIAEGVAQAPGRLMQHLSGLLQLPSEIEGIASASPGRVGKNLVSGTAKLGRAIANIPPNVLEALGFPGIFPTAPEFDIDKTLGLQDKQPGDALAQGFTEKFPSGIAAAYGAIPLMGVEALQAIGNKENPLTAALTSGLERLTGKAIAKGAKTVPVVAKSFSNDKMTKRILKEKARAINKSKSEFKEALPKEAPPVKLPNFKTKELLENSTTKESSSLKKALAKPTVKNVHLAQMDLGKIERKLSKSHGEGKLLSGQIKALNQATKAKKALLDSLKKTLESHGGKQLSDKYTKARKNYIKDTIPYKENKNIFKYENNKLKSGNLVRKLANDDAFMLSVGKKHPELAFSDFTSGILNKVGLGTKLNKGLEAAKLIKGIE
jgi:hypothetical protein